MKVRLRRHWMLLGLACAGLGLLMLTIGWSLFQTRLSLTAVHQFELEAAAASAHQAQPVAHSLNLITARRFKSVEAWDEGLSLIQDLPTLVGNISVFTQPSQLETGTDQAAPSSTLPELVTRSLRLSELIQASWLLQRLAPQNVNQASQLRGTLQTLNQALLSGTHTYLLVFQNTDELRATGGFIGSYASVKLTNGQIAELEIQDIYQPDGQFTGYVEAPPGVKEYLSSGKGLRLPDANWWPDFPSSAQKMMPFFGLGQEKAVEGMVAINLSVAEKLLQVTGPVFLPDYQTTVDASNIAQVARADRAEFFPGSQSKPHFLSSLFKQLKFKLGDLTAEQKKELALHLIASLQTKNIQLYSNDQSLQTLFDMYGLSGQATTQVQNQPSDLSLFLVESNVGINKANREVQRSVKLEISDYRTLAEISFVNSNQTPAAPTTGADHLHYVNYQRILIPPTVEIKNITIQGKPVEVWDEALTSTHTGEKLKQIGFLVAIPEQSTITLTFELTHPPLPAKPNLWIQKQSGLPPTPYSISFNGQTKNLLLETDEVIEF